MTHPRHVFKHTCIFSKTVIHNTLCMTVFEKIYLIHFIGGQSKTDTS